MSASEDEPDRDIAAVLNELIDLVREVKQIEWIAHTSSQGHVLEHLEEFLVRQIDAVTRVEVEIGSPLTRLVTPSARQRIALDSSSARDAVRERLVPHLRAVAADVREHAKNSGEPVADFLQRLADDLDRFADELDLPEESSPKSSRSR